MENENNNLELLNSQYKLYNNLITIKKKEDITLYPYNIISCTQVIFTKNQIDLYYINNYNTCTENKKEGSYESNIQVVFY
jgi:hypothetical protein